MYSAEPRAARGHHLSRRVMLRTALSGAAVAVGGAILAACGEGAASTPAPTSGASVATPRATVAPATVAAATVVPTGGATSTASTSGGTATQLARPAQASAIEGQIASSVDGVPDAYAKLPPPFRSATTVPGKGARCGSS